MTSNGPAFFRQVRVGRDGKNFHIVKFRTMYPGSERMVVHLAAQNEQDGLLFKMRDDPRVTPIGRFLRRYSLDELPQLVNVFTGDMSLVGPRPPLPTRSERYPDDMRRRLVVKPGMTGLWQVSGRSDLPWDEGDAPGPSLCGKLVAIVRSGDSVADSHRRDAFLGCVLTIGSAKRNVLTDD